MDCNSTELQSIFFIYYGEEDQVKMPWASLAHWRRK